VVTRLGPPARDGPKATVHDRSGDGPRPRRAVRDRSGRDPRLRRAVLDEVASKAERL